MRVAYLRPTSNGDYGEYGSGWGYDKLDEEVADGDLTAISLATNDYSKNGWRVFGCNTLDLRGKILEVIVRVIARQGGGYYASAASTRLRTHDTIYSSTNTMLPVGDYGWKDCSKSYTQNPYTGAVWTWAEINALQIGLGLAVSGPNGYCYATQTFAEIYFNPIQPRAQMIGLSL